MIEYIVRGLLFLHGFMLSKQGTSYVKIPRNEVFLTLLKKEGLEGPGLDIAVPFLGIAYLTIGMFNILAALAFYINEASYVLFASGIAFHIGMATIRAKLDTHTADLYKPGMIRQTNIMQYGIGIVCCTIGIIGCFYK